MDVNEEIVAAWMQEQGFFVKGREKFRVKGEKKSSGWSDIDLICYNPIERKCVAIDISAWMTETITRGYFNPNSKANTRHRILKITEPEARAKIREYLGVTNDNQYEIWLVLSKISERQKEDVIKECKKAGITKVIEFKDVMSDLIKIIKKNPNPSRDEGSLQTIRALIWCDLLKDD